MYLKEYEEAQNEMLRAIDLHKNDHSFAILGKIHLLQGDLQGAIEVYKLAVT